MLLRRIKESVLPDGPRALPILTGPFRGAWLHTSLRHNLRKVLGLYEHELNGWLEKVLPKIDTVLDVGANDGYFTLGCAAAFRRFHRSAMIFAFEPQAVCCEQIRTSAEKQGDDAVRVVVEETFVGLKDEDGQISLDGFSARTAASAAPGSTLIKIDVEGAELDVVDGAASWLKPSNYFLIEVHRECYLEELKGRFAAAGISLQQYDEEPLPILGPEQRPEKTWWLATALG